MSNNIKYIISFINNKNNKILCYIKNEKYINFSFTKLKNEAFRYNFISDALLSNCNFFNNSFYKKQSQIFACINKLNITEYYLYFDNIKKSNIKIVLCEYDILKEERKNKIKKIFETKN
jgi:hypothetical protein